MTIPKLIFAGLFLFYYANLLAQNSSLSKRLSVFIDCNGISCDEDYIHTEIKIVDFLNDRQSADLHILVTAQPTGNGAEKFQLITYGQNVYKGYIDTLFFTTKINGSEAEKRLQLLHFLQPSLAPILAKTSFAESFSLDMKKDSGKFVNVATKDPWYYLNMKYLPV